MSASDISAIQGIMDDYKRQYGDPMTWDREIWKEYEADVAEWQDEEEK